MTTKDTLKLIIGAYEMQLSGAEVKDAEIRACHGRINSLEESLRVVITVVSGTCQNQEASDYLEELSRILKEAKDSAAEIKQISEQAGRFRAQTRAEIERIKNMIGQLPGE